MFNDEIDRKQLASSSTVMYVDLPYAVHPNLARSAVVAVEVAVVDADEDCVEDIVVVCDDVAVLDIVLDADAETLVVAVVVAVLMPVAVAVDVADVDNDVVAVLDTEDACVELSDEVAVELRVVV